MKLLKRFSRKDIRRLLRCVEALKLGIAPIEEEDPEWKNIDRFLKKPGNF